LSLTFTHMDDFRPERLVDRVDDLKKLLTARQRLNDLLAKLEGNDELSAALKEIVDSTEALQKIKDEVSKDQP
jgi:type VI secretion system protein ImpB